ncbi:ABC transporter permease [Candidatus Latescibacterota bacterium]
MNYRENLFVGVEGLRSHLLRSILSMLGIIFGVGAVIAMLSIGEGAKQQALEQIQLMGMNNIIVQDVAVSQEGESQKRTSLSMGLQWADADAVTEINPYVQVSVPLTEKTMNARYLNETVRATVVGTTPEYTRVISYYPASGAFINYLDIEEARRVCVLGNGIRRQLFLFQDPIGERIKISDQWFTVVGVMEEKLAASNQQSSFDIRDLNMDIYIPITTSLERFSRRALDSEINRFISRVDDVGQIQEASNILNATMARRHNDVNDFNITIPEALLQQSMQTQRIFNIVMGAIAGISLVVGGIGIMNIMLAAVLERTREIGVRRATGATQQDILSQFLTESVLLSFTGGILGIILGFAMTRIIAAYAGWRTIVSWEAILLAFCVSVGVGVLFGVYPARRAAFMNPIDALRYE